MYLRSTSLIFSGRKISLILIMAISLLLAACGSENNNAPTSPPDSPAPVDLWSWISGSETGNQAGVYSDPDPVNNIPGARYESVSWADGAGNLWLFGGSGYDGGGSSGSLNDLWKYDGNQWSWVSGSDTVNQPGVYSDPDPANNVPGSRIYPVSWTDSSDNFWLFGGNASGTGLMNDLWKFDGSNWTWVLGSNSGHQLGIYGSLGEANGASVPGARTHSASWIDSSGNLWLFGGTGYGSAAGSGKLNDLWKFDGTNWTWVSGSQLTNQDGVYNDADPSKNVPGSRGYSVTWVDANDNLWLFGGYGRGAATFGDLNDLWKFDGTNWIFVSGSDTANQGGSYGTRGIPEAGNHPGSRSGSVSWSDTSGNQWLFGGWGYDSTATWQSLNDLWKFDGVNWAWISGSDSSTQNGIYNDVDSANNIAGGRGDSVAWRDTSGNLWLFGGWGFDSAGTEGYLNDLWRYEP